MLLPRIDVRARVSSDGAPASLGPHGNRDAGWLDVTPKGLYSPGDSGTPARSRRP